MSKGGPQLAVGTPNVLIIGNPLAGKTRAMYELLKHSKRKYDVTILKRPDTFTSLDFHIPLRFTFWRKRVLVLDDVDKFAGIQGFTYLLNEYFKHNVIILATCRSGIEYEKLCASIEREMALFGDPIELSKVTRDTAEDVAQQVGKDVPETFDGNIGSIFVPIDTMKQRFKEATSEEKGILRSLKRLHAAGIYRGKDVFSIDRLKKVSELVKGVKGQPHEWDEWLEKLKSNGFFEKDKDEVRIEETYLEQVIEDDFSPLVNLRQMLDIFSNDPDAAFDIGNEASNRGLVDIQKAAFMKVAIDAYGKTLTVWTFDNNPEQYAMTQNNLGIAYGKLAEVEETAENCRAAITAFQEALSVRTVDRFPIQYANTQNNLGNAYAMLPEEQDKAANCRLAISAYREALKVRTLFRFPMDYALTQNNLGAAYQALAEVEEGENKADSCKRAMTAFQEVLKVYNPDVFAKEYAMTQNNFGNAYKTLADAEKEVEKKAANHKLAIEAYHKTLKVYSLDHFPIDYAMAEYNLGKAYRSLAELEEKAKNCRLAIAAFQEALKVRSFDQFPILYAKTQIGLGTAYGTLLDVEDKPGNCRRAREAFEEALKIYTEELPEPHAKVIHNLEILYGLCKDVPGF
jgi:tetratricopeptide (TPR) repeat protein